MFFSILGWMHKLSWHRDVTTAECNEDQLEDLGIFPDPEEEKYIVPLPVLYGYDASEDAAGDSDSVSKRDDLLIEHFVYLVDDGGVHRVATIHRAGRQSSEAGKTQVRSWACSFRDAGCSGGERNAESQSSRGVRSSRVSVEMGEDFEDHD